jgi:hypothetical protein
MNVHKFSLAEMYNNSSGKTSASLVAAHVLVLTGCVMGVKGAFTMHGETMLQGIAFATLGAALLGIRRVTNDKSIPDTADPLTITKTKEVKEEIKID